MPTIRIQPSADELEKILFPDGPDTPYALEIRQNVVEEIGRRHLKSVVNMPDFKVMARRLDEEATKLLLDTYATSEGRTLRLNAAARQLFALEIDAAMKEAVKEVRGYLQLRLDAMQEEFEKNMASYRHALDIRMSTDMQSMVDSAVRKEIGRRFEASK
jgi:hypothetical protein